MCTLTLAWRAFADAPVAVAANRDEARDRPSEPPERIGEDPAVVAPRDARAGGTWIGYSERGVFVGITNRPVEGLAGERSRGLLVRDCLRRSTAEDAARFVEEAVREHEYDGFNLVVADADAAVLLEWDGRLRVTTLDPGVHVVVNVGVDGAYYEPPGRPEAGPEQANDARRVRDALRPEPGEDADGWLDRAADVLGDHDYGVCVHRDASGERSDGSSNGGYGTVSSSLLALRADGSVRYDFADGPPCETDHEPVEETVPVSGALDDRADRV